MFDLKVTGLYARTNKEKKIIEGCEGLWQCKIDYILIFIDVFQLHRYGSE
jgi:hypothetical protein